MASGPGKPSIASVTPATTSPEAFVVTPAPAWTMRGFDPAHSDWNPGETVLTAGTASGGGALSVGAYDGHLYRFDTRPSS